MEIASRDARGMSKEEADILRRSKWRNNEADGEAPPDPSQNKRFVSYRDSVIGAKEKEDLGQDVMTGDGGISDDDEVEDGDDDTYFGMGMTREEKWEARQRWRNGAIIKLIGKSISYHFLWRRIRAMWRTQDEPLLIDLGFDFFIAKLGRR